MNTIHINADVGEDSENETELLSLVSACNIACGGHAGTVESMQHIVDKALEHHVQIGAHPSYPDRVHFGRRSMEMEAQDLRRSLIAQILSLKQIAEAEGGKLSHVKLHGALYHDANQRQDIAKIVLEVLQEFHYEMALYTPENSVMASLAEGKVELVYEAFADRRYKDIRQLVPRSEKAAVITDKEELLQQVLDILLERKVRTVEGEWINCKADTFCIHADSPKAFENLSFLKEELEIRQIKIAKY